MDKDSKEQVNGSNETSSVDAVDWSCTNCKETNKAEATHCKVCGFEKNYDPDRLPQLDFMSIKAAVEEQSSKRDRNIGIYLEMVKNGVLVALLAVALIIGFRLYNNWPFQGPFEEDANALSNQVMTVYSHLEIGTDDQTYNEIIVPLMVEKEKFKIKYMSTSHSQRTAYQKLIQASEYYVLAQDDWSQRIEDGPTTLRIRQSDGAPESVKNLWNTAGSNALQALEDLN